MRLAQVHELLQRQGRVSYRAFRLRFQLDDETLAALKDELIYAERVARDEEDRVGGVEAGGESHRRGGAKMRQVAR